MQRLLLALLALTAAAALLTWPIGAFFEADGIDLGFHGTIAVFLCLLLIPSITIGLMLLLRLSHDKGFDDRAR